MSHDEPAFRHQVIDPDPPGAHHDITLLLDLNEDGLRDIVIGCKEGHFHLFWYQNPSWERHVMAVAPNLEAGGVAFDVDGDGRLDIIAGQQWGGHELYWFECPPDPRDAWTKHLIEDRFEKYHDQAVGDVDGDGEPEIVALSQRSQVLVYYDLPEDPRLSPWPRHASHVIAQGLVELEGLAIVDIDGDGVTEIIAGPNIFRPGPDPAEPWVARPIAPGYEKTRVAVADLNGDGQLDIVLCEGESHPGRLAWLAGPDWQPRILRDDLFHPHSLEIADFNGDGLPDIFVGEMGLGQNQDPKLLLYLNRGQGEFQEVLVQRGIPTHEAKVADMNGNGRPDIVGKPYMPEKHIDVWWNEA